MKEFTFTWSIEDISHSWHKTGEYIVSPIFYAGSLQNTAWILLLYPRGCDNSDYLSLYLYRMEDQFPKDIAVNFEFSCISADRSVLNSYLIPHTFTTFGRGGNPGYGESHFMQRHEVFGRRKALYLPKDILTLRCRMWKDEGHANEFEQIFGRTRLTTETIISVANMNPENEVQKTFHIHSKGQNKALVSISVLYFDDKIDVEMNPINEGKMKFSTLKFSFKDKRTGRKLCQLITSFYGASEKEKWRLPFSDKMQPKENDNSSGNDFEFITEFVYSTGEEIEILEEDYQLQEDLPPRNSEFLSNYIISCVPSGKLTDCSTIAEDLWNLYVLKLFCDVELKAQKKTFFAHKFVLCARSSVFMAMLTGEMKEKINACIEIEDISPIIFELFLKFLYTDIFEDLEWDTVIQLYYAADKYQIERLTLLCSSYLLKNIDVDNVCELLILADRHHDCELKREVHDFIWKNEEKVYRSSTWMKFAYEQQQLFIQTSLTKYEKKENHSPAETYDDRLRSVPRIRDDFGSLYLGHIVSDVLSKAKGSTFSAHKTVLCASSSTFREVFRNDLRDKSTDFFEMGEWDDDIVSRMLLFLYTDSLEDIQWDTTIMLYQVAARYQIQRLQFKCSCLLLENLKVSNASNLLLLAHEHNDVKLKSAVEDFIVLHDEEIFGSDEWAEFSKTNLLLANETMRAKYKKIK